MASFVEFASSEGLASSGGLPSCIGLVSAAGLASAPQLARSSELAGSDELTSWMASAVGPGSSGVGLKPFSEATTSVGRTRSLNAD